MRHKLLLFFKEFQSRNGSHVFMATILARILSFLSSWVALQFIANFELGLVIYALNIIIIISPISGLGASQGLLRYGALLDSNREKKNLFTYILKRGTLFSFLLISLIILGSSYITSGLKESQAAIIPLAFLLFGLFLLESLKTMFRILNKNKIFAFIEITYNAILFALVCLGSYFLEEKGYVLAMLLAPIITFCLYFPILKISWKPDLSFAPPKIEFWKYSFFSSMSNVATQLLLVLDIILIGNLMQNPEMITIYKYVALIPMSIIFIPNIFITTDFVMLTNNLKNKKSTSTYIKNYMMVFFILSLIIVLISMLFDKTILSFFGEEFPQYYKTFDVLILGIISILVFRGLFGNLLSALGKASVNFWIAIIAIVINIALNFMLIPKYGVFGAAITSALLMWITGILSIVLFYYYYKKL
jgi:O-antigen/teichoic acid export membrane protein